MCAGNLVSCDKQTAQIVFAMLGSTAIEEPERASQKAGLQQDLQLALTGALALHPADTQQVECLLGVAMSSTGINLPTQDVAKAARQAGCLHLGIRQVTLSACTGTLDADQALSPVCSL